MDLIKKYKIPTPKEKRVKTDETLEFDMFPCVLKIDMPLHKSEVGGVIRGILNNEELNKAKKIILNNLKKHNIEIDKNTNFLIQEKIEGIELIVGGKFDDIFEEVLIFGKGGILVEVKKDITYIDTEADEEEIIKAIKKTKISKIFPEFRGKKYNLNAVIDVIKKLQIMFKNEEIIEFDINPLIVNEKGAYAVDVRIKEGKKNKKAFYPKKYSLFENQNVAIFGATDKEKKVGYAIAKNSLNSSANIYFVNPHLDTLFNKKVYHSIEELPKIDTSVIAIPTKFVLKTVEEMAKRGCKNFIVISAGFKEAGNIEAELKLKELAVKYDLNIVGPNCLGIYNGDKNLNLTFAKSSVFKGEIGLISQSGAVLSALMDKAASFKIGFSHIISMGNMADFNFANAIYELNNQATCKTISIYAEGIQYGKEFLKAIRNSKKEIFVYKAGKSEAAKKAAFSHTGNLAGNFEMFKILSENAGAKFKDSIESLILAPKFKAKEIIIVTNAGGPGTILTDLVSKNAKLKELDKKTIEKLNEVLPLTWSHNNPIDVIGDATEKRYKAALEIVKEEADLIFVIITPQFMTDALSIVKILDNEKYIPILLGDESFTEAISYLKNNNKIFFTSLEEAAKIL
jgi:acyl-CoA synthetase (NDP forming)